MKLVWDQVGQKLYETGVSHGVLYPAVNGTYPKGVAWNGITGVTESPSGAEATPLYADNVKYLSLTSAETFGAKIEAFMYPDEFATLDGAANVAEGVQIGQQQRGVFGLSYKTVLGNDTDSNKYGYKIHIIYGAQATPSERAYATVNDSPEAMTLSWTLTTTPVSVNGFDPTATMVIDSTKIPADRLELLEGILYGTESTSPRLPFPDEIATIVGSGLPSAFSMTSIVPADNANAVAVGASIVITFNTKISSESIVVSSATGAVISCTKTFDTAGKVLTIKPNSNLAAATKYYVTMVGIADIYSRTLPTTIKTFTTA